MAKLEPVPGEPLSQEQQLKIVKAQAYLTLCSNPTSSTVVMADSAARLDKLYPTLPRIGQEETIKGLLETPVDEIELTTSQYTFQGRFATAQLLYLDPVLEELMPKANFRPADGYYFSISSYRDVRDRYRYREINFCVIDRGNYSGWLRTALWYYRRKQNIKRYVTMWNDRFEVWIDGMIERDVLEVADKVFDVGWLNAYPVPAVAP